MSLQGMKTKMPDMKMSDFDFDLPPERIAQQPAERRDASRLLTLLGNAPPSHHTFTDLPSLLRPGDLLVRNDTRVIPARLLGTRVTGGKAELLLIQQEKAEVPGRIQEQWLCLARPAKQLQPGKTIRLGNGVLIATVLANYPGGKVSVAFTVAGNESFQNALTQYGAMPLPPYIARKEDAGAAALASLDAERYQTVYATTPGAVAAPTAGLHFTPEVEAALADRKIEIAHLTLHVGPGTFRPISADTVAAHEMDAEWYSISEACAAAINRARAADRRVIAVGTTATRALEANTTRIDKTSYTQAGEGWTNIFIRPGYTFKAIHGLLTNFHLPKSSLLVLVSALAGREKILAAYAEAIQREYRFYSYGDAMLILPG